MKTYKVYYLIPNLDEPRQKEILADRAGITPEGHLVFESVKRSIAADGAGREKSQFIAAFSDGYWLRFEEMGQVAHMEKGEVIPEEIVDETIVEEAIEEPVVKEPRPMTDEEILELSAEDAQE